MSPGIKLVSTGLVSALLLLPVLFVNNALGIFTTFDEGTGPPVIEVKVEDFCRSIKDVLVTVEVYPHASYLEIGASKVDLPTECEHKPYALITVTNLIFRTVAAARSRGADSR